MERFERRIALITGANKGIGFEIARQLGHAGVTVIIGCRDRERGESAATILRGEGLDTRAVELDVTNMASVQRVADAISTDYGQLDILVNNAGISDSADGRPEAASIDAAKRIFDTNFFSVLAVTQAMLPLLHQSHAGRIVNMSSSLGSMTVNGDPSSRYYGAHFIGYNASKAALNMLTVQLAETLRETPILVNAACPGYVKTDLNGHGGYLSPAQGAATPVRLALLSDEKLNGKLFNAEGMVAW